MTLTRIDDIFGLKYRRRREGAAGARDGYYDKAPRPARGASI
jgi:hypothetical protein